MPGVATNDVCLDGPPPPMDAANELCREGPDVNPAEAGPGLEGFATAESVPTPNVLSRASVSSTSAASLSEGASEASSGSTWPASIACSLAVVRMSSCCVSSMYSFGGLGASGGGDGTAVVGS